MKIILLTLFVAAVSAVPLPDDSNGPVEMIVNGVPDGEALDIGHIVDIKLNEHAEGGVVASDLLHPFSAAGIAEANLNAPEPHREVPAPVDLPAPAPPAVEVADIPDSILLPEPGAPIVEVPEIPDAVHLPQPLPPVVEVPEPIVMPDPLPPVVEVPEPIVMPDPLPPVVEVPVPDPIYLPPPGPPEVVEDIPAPAAHKGEIYNDGHVSVNFNGPEDPGMLTTLSSWFNMVMNYFNQEGNAASDQIV